MLSSVTATVVPGVNHLGHQQVLPDLSAATRIHHATNTPSGGTATVHSHDTQATTCMSATLYGSALYRVMQLLHPHTTSYPHVTHFALLLLDSSCCWSTPREK
jgi:hypothetical protein